MRCIRCHFLYDTETPLVLLVVVGLSGHGKPELASPMDSLLSLLMLNVDCTYVLQMTDIFGPQAPYYGHDEGSPLNNHSH